MFSALGLVHAGYNLSARVQIGLRAGVSRWAAQNVNNVSLNVNQQNVPASETFYLYYGKPVLTLAPYLRLAFGRGKTRFLPAVYAGYAHASGDGSGTGMWDGNTYTLKATAPASNGFAGGIEATVARTLGKRLTVQLTVGGEVAVMRGSGDYHFGTSYNLRSVPLAAGISCTL